jgi:hypothetical protein
MYRAPVGPEPGDDVADVVPSSEFIEHFSQFGQNTCAPLLTPAGAPKSSGSDGDRESRASHVIFIGSTLREPKLCR